MAAPDDLNAEDQPVGPISSEADETGLRERKKRETRQRISDVATMMFVERGYDNVRISEIADEVGVSEKTIYNYFPTKESLVFDRAEDDLQGLTNAVRNRPAGSSPIAAFVAGMKADMDHFGTGLRDDNLATVQAFSQMINETPALRAAWGEHRHTMVAALTGILAAEAGVDPRDPEPVSAARAMVSLFELGYDSLIRHIDDGVGADGLNATVAADLDRGARLLETGLWSFVLMVEGRKTKDQLRDAAIAAERARQQVMSALRDARTAFRAIRDEARLANREAQEANREAVRELHRARRDAVREMHQQAREKSRENARLRGRGKS